MKPMRVTEGFRLFVLEQLAAVGTVHARPMFGGLGLYADEFFFGIVAADTLFLRVDESNRLMFTAAGMKPFQPYEGKASSRRYYQVPVAVIEDSTELAVWTAAAIRAAKTAATGPVAKGLRKGRRRA
jgi:DNA transformation protein